MKLSSRTKIVFLLVGDVAALYLALALTLAIRYGGGFYEQFANAHALPFSIAFAVWLFVFYVAGLYDLPRLRNNLDFIKTLGLVLFINALLTITLFYLIPFFGIAPKTNLFIFIAVFSILETWWRRTFNVRASFREGLNKVLLIGNGTSVEEITAELKKNPQVGYEITYWIKDEVDKEDLRDVRKIAAQNDVNLIVIPHNLRKDEALTRSFYELLISGLEIIDIPTFYELVFRKVPLRDIGETWFLENRIGQKQFYDDLKRGLEVVSAFLLLIVLSPLWISITVLVRLTAPDRAICAQTRVGHANKTYSHRKFRTMRSCNEKGGAAWKKAEGGKIVDARLTHIGRVLSYSHLDELPQLLNILKGEMSFVGPRPERPEFVALLEEKVPFYQVRHLVRPGVTGWAQINYPYGGSIEGTYEKLQYDLYYLKNRSLILDFAILIKTVKTLFINPQ